MKINVMGSVSNYVKAMALEQKWEKSGKNPYKIREDKEKDAAERMMDSYRKQMEDIRKQQEISSIESKLKSGMKLSDSDIEYLKKNCPDLYEKAVAIEKEREEYKRELKKCNSKEDVQKLNMRKIQMLASEMKSVEGNANIPAEKKRDLIEYISMRLTAINNEHAAFTETPEYKNLPDKDEDANEEKAGFDEGYLRRYMEYLQSKEFPGEEDNGGSDRVNLRLNGTSAQGEPENSQSVQDKSYTTHDGDTYTGDIYNSFQNTGGSEYKISVSYKI